MKRSLFARLWRHPVFVFTRIGLLGFTTAIPIDNLVVIERLRADGDPVKIANWNLDRVLTSAVAKKQIEAALSNGELDIADGIVSLARERNIFVAPDLTAKVRQAVVDQRSLSATATQFGRGFLTGKSTDTSSFAGAMTGDYFVYGDLRDFVLGSIDCVTGEHCDPWVLGFAGTGIALTAVTYTSSGLTAPERTGLSVIKFAERDRRLNRRLLTRIGELLLKPADLGTFAENLADIGEHGGLNAALDSLSFIEGPEDALLVERLAIAKGKEARTLLRLLGRKAFRLGVTGYEIAKWAVWALLGFLAFCASCKAKIERMTQDYLMRKKLRRVRKQLGKVIPTG